MERKNRSDQLGHADVPISQLPAQEPAVPALEDVELQEKSTAKDEEAAGHLDQPRAAGKDQLGLVKAPEEEEGGANGVRAVIGGFNVSFCTWGFAGSWSVTSSFAVHARRADTMGGTIPQDCVSVTLRDARAVEPLIKRDRLDRFGPAYVRLPQQRAMRPAFRQRTHEQDVRLLLRSPTLWSSLS